MDKSPTPNGPPVPRAPVLPPACLYCGYEVVGLAVGQRCPECGHEIRTPREDRATPRLAEAALVCGAWGFLMIVGALIVLPAVVLGVPLSVIGLGLSLAARAKIRRDPYSYDRGSTTIAWIGFWLSVPGVAVVVIVGAIIVSGTAF